MASPDQKITGCSKWNIFYRWDGWLLTLDPGNGKTKKAYLWAYRSNDLQPGPKIIVFDYQAGRSGRHAQQFLQDWQGHLMVDDYGGYKALFAAARAHPESQCLLEPCVELACLTHARRKFFDLFQASQGPVAQEATSCSSSMC